MSCATISSFSDVVELSTSAVSIHTCTEDHTCAQVAEGQAHDRGFVQVAPDALWQGQLLSQLTEEFSLLTAAKACCLTRPLLTAV